VVLLPRSVPGGSRARYPRPPLQESCGRALMGVRAQRPETCVTSSSRGRADPVEKPGKSGVELMGPLKIRHVPDNAHPARLAVCQKRSSTRGGRSKVSAARSRRLSPNAPERPTPHSPSLASRAFSDIRRTFWMWQMWETSLDGVPTRPIGRLPSKSAR
jgi:hypothetical protein